MYKEYMSISKRGADQIGGGAADDWKQTWQGRPFSTEKQIQTLKKSPQWKAISRYSKPGWKIIEAGCGLGSWVRFLHSQGLNPVGVDYEDSTVTRLQQAFPSFDWKVGDIRALPFEESTYDALVSWGVIEHMEEGPQAAVNEFYRVLRPNGLAFVTVPWLSDRRIRGGMMNGGDNLASIPKPSESAFRQYYMTYQELSDFMKQAGFTVVSIEPSSIHAKSLLSREWREKNRLARFCLQI